VTSIHIDGVATTNFVKHSDEDLADLAASAARHALADAGLDREDVGLVVCGSVHGGDGLGQRIAARLGIGRVPVLNTENACASSSVAAMVAASLIRNEVAGTALVVGAEKMSDRAGAPIVDSHSSYDYDAHDVSWPVMYALDAMAAIADGDFDEADMAAVAVNNRRGAQLNPHAQFRTAIDATEVLSSRVIAGPVRLLMCSPRSDGASALVMTDDRRRSARHHPDVVIRASHLLAGALLDGVDRPDDTVTAAAATRIYEQANIEPKQVDVVELHDAFAPAELHHLVSLGLVEPGGAGDLVRRQADGVEPRWVNPSGGLLSRGHPIGATGAAQLTELTRQLRGQAGERQVPNARVALSHTMGGTVFELESNACMLHLLERVS
jgi:benzoylsuccinyl-CoA thiolase BbsB subunit